MRSKDGKNMAVTAHRSFSGLHFSAFELNMETYGVNLRIQSQCGKMHTKKNSEYGHYSRSECDSTLCCTFGVSYYQQYLGLKNREPHPVCFLHKLTNSCSENL